MGDERDSLQIRPEFRHALQAVVEPRDPLQAIVELPPPGEILPRDPTIQFAGEVGPE